MISENLLPVRKEIDNRLINLLESREDIRNQIPALLKSARNWNYVTNTVTFAATACTIFGILLAYANKSFISQLIPISSAILLSVIVVFNPLKRATLMNELTNESRRYIKDVDKFEKEWNSRIFESKSSSSQEDYNFDHYFMYLYGQFILLENKMEEISDSLNRFLNI